ncbi:MAG: cytochrome d ubiquinol oxidase subunit II [Acidimicrobiales bacterium]
MNLQNFWFGVVAFFWVGFFVLEGFDFGVGALHTVVGKTDIERRVAINTIGPFWDANEVWLIVAGAATFAAFPSWYATMFSALYLALMLIIVALVARGVSFEYRGKSESPRWRLTWSWALTIGSVLLPVLLGVGLGDLLHGLPINQSGEYTGTFWDLLTPYGLWVGLTLLALTLLHGSVFLVLRTTGVVHDRARRLSGPLGWLAVAVVAVFATWTHVVSGQGVIPGPLPVFAVLAVIAAAWAVREGHDGWAFTATTIAMAGTVVSLFVDLYPNVMISSTNKAYNLTVANSASGNYALKVMTIVAVIFAPLVLAYQGWNFHVFRARVTGPRATAPDGSTAPSTVGPAPPTAAPAASDGPPAHRTDGPDPQGSAGGADL